MPYIINENGESVRVEMYQAPPQMAQAASKMAQALKMDRASKDVEQLAAKVRTMPIEKYEEEEDNCGGSDDDDNKSNLMWVLLLLALIAIGIGVWMCKRKDSSSTTEESPSSCGMPARFGFRFY